MPPWVPRMEAPVGPVPYAAPEVLELQAAEPGGNHVVEDDVSQPEASASGFEQSVPPTAAAEIRGPPLND